MKTLKPGPKPRLNECQRAAIRRERMGVKQIAAKYGVQPNVIYRVLRGVYQCN